MPIAGS